MRAEDEERDRIEQAVTRRQTYLEKENRRLRDRIHKAELKVKSLIVEHGTKVHLTMQELAYLEDIVTYYKSEEDKDDQKTAEAILHKIDKVIQKTLEG